MSEDGRGTAYRMVAKLAAGALLGKVLGFFREVAMASVLGASLPADSFRAAHTATFLPLTPMQNESVPAVLIPMHKSWQEAGWAPARLAALCIAVTAIGAALALVTVVFAQWVMGVLVAQMSAPGMAMAADFLRIMALSMPPAVLLDSLSAAEIGTGRSRITALRASILNVAIFIALGLYLWTGQILWMPTMFTGSFYLLALWCLVSLGRDGTLSLRGVTLSLVIDVAGEYFRRLRPMLALPIVQSFQIWMERLVASGIGLGAVASLGYARTLSETAVLLVSQPIGMALLYHGASARTTGPALSIARPALAIAVPGSAFVAFFATDIVSLVFQRGAFDARAVELTASILAGSAVGLWAATLGLILMRMLNNDGRNVRASLILVAALAVNTAVNVSSLYLPLSSSQGAMLLGLGEAGRGLVLLAGTALAIKCHREVLSILVRTLPAVAVMAALAVVIQGEVDGALMRVALGGGACVLAIGLGCWMLVPDLAASAYRRLTRQPEAANETDRSS
jgi:putative peptidoglycan lipid II flippase